MRINRFNTLGISPRHVLRCFVKPRVKLWVCLSTFWVFSAQAQSAIASVSCETLISQLESRLFIEPDNHNLMAALQLVVNRCSAVEQTLQSAPWQIQGRFDQAVGYHSNPLYSSSAKEFLLTLPDQSYALTNPNKAQSSFYAETALSLSLSREGTLLEVQLQQRPYLMQEDTRSTQSLNTESLYNLSAWYLKSRSAVMANVRQYSYQQDLYHQYSLNYRLLTGTSQMHSVEIGQRNFNQNTYHDSRYLQYLYSIGNLKWTANGQWRFDLMGLVDTPNQSRAGATQLMGQASLQWGYTQDAHSWIAVAALAYQKDQQGYSPYLNHNAQRELTRVNTQIQWRYQLQPAQQLYTLIGWNSQWSNINLFEWQSTQLQLGWQIKW